MKVEDVRWLMEFAATHGYKAAEYVMEHPELRGQKPAEEREEEQIACMIRGDIKQTALPFEVKEVPEEDLKKAAAIIRQGTADIFQNPDVPPEEAIRHANFMRFG